MAREEAAARTQAFDEALVKKAEALGEGPPNPAGSSALSGFAAAATGVGGIRAAEQQRLQAEMSAELGAGLKGSIGDRSNHSNFSHQNSVKILVRIQENFEILTLIVIFFRKS